MWFHGPLIPANVAVEDDRLTTDDNIISSDSETEQNDLTSDENIVSESENNLLLVCEKMFHTMNFAIFYVR